MKEFVKLELAEAEWTFRALDLDQIEALEPQFLVVSNLGTGAASIPKEGLAAVAEIACESLKFKHQTINLAQCRKLITLATMEQVLNAVRGISGLDPVPGEATARVG